MLQSHHDTYINNPDWKMLESNESLLRIKPNRQDWQGFGDSRMLSNGILVGRGDVINPTEAIEPPMYFNCHIGLHIILDASYILDFKDINRHVDISANQIWRREGELGHIGANWRANSRHRVVTIDFSPELLARWAEDFALPTWLKVGGNYMESLNHIDNSAMVLARAQQILNQSTDSLADMLSLESMVLQLCADSFQNKVLNTSKIDDVIDIICTEYMQPLTISELALRVGMNECYLKRDFKTHTGDTIATYIRNLRMQEAMRLLLDENKTLQETAFFIGYKDPAYFSKIFKNHFGMSPKLLKID